jgi:hypothetical protein
MMRCADADEDKSLYPSNISMEIRRLNGDEATNLILDVLREAGMPLSTREIQQQTEKKLVRCPDNTIVFLNRLRLKGVIKGERNKEKRGWVWWVDT